MKKKLKGFCQGRIAVFNKSPTIISDAPEFIRVLRGRGVSEEGSEAKKKSSNVNEVKGLIYVVYAI